MAKSLNYQPCLTPGFQARQALPHWPWVLWVAPSGPVLALFLFLIQRGKQRPLGLAGAALCKSNSTCGTKPQPCQPPDCPPG